jgi:chemotaxis protein CheD
MKNHIHVSTGEVNAAKETTILMSAAIGSCVVIAAYDVANKIGALAHIMLPGTSPFKRTSDRTRYAEDAIEEMIGMMTGLGTDRENIEVCLVGGANVLKRKDDTIGQDNIDSVTELLTKQNIDIKAKVVGGFERMSVTLNVENGTIYHSIGDGTDKLLWSFLNDNQKVLVK